MSKREVPGELGERGECEDDRTFSYLSILPVVGGMFHTSWMLGSCMLGERNKDERSGIRNSKGVLPKEWHYPEEGHGKGPSGCGNEERCRALEISQMGGNQRDQSIACSNGTCAWQIGSPGWLHTRRAK